MQHGRSGYCAPGETAERDRCHAPPKGNFGKIIKKLLSYLDMLYGQSGHCSSEKGRIDAVSNYIIFGYQFGKKNA